MIEIFNDEHFFLSLCLSKGYEKLKGIQGVVVEYPLYFLDDEEYAPSMRTREGNNNYQIFHSSHSMIFHSGIIPVATWT